MGLLTDPSAGQGRITKGLVKYYTKICILLYIVGVAWFCVLPYTPLNVGTYFSENALLPGLVKSEFRDDVIAVKFHEELLDEMKKYDDSIPYPWLLAKFRQIGLDAYTHNFTLYNPLGKAQHFTGKNVYGILRAPRASSTESLVMSVPYRTTYSVDPTTTPSIAIMLAFAKFAAKEKYWSKDIIFLITEHEQLGVQAWLEAYYSVTCGQENVLDHGDLKGRAGAIQAAINLEFHDTDIGRMDIKIEGLNGQLPNLDLFNLATRMCTKEGVHHTFKNRANRNMRDTFQDWSYSFQTLMAMVSSQATGVPNGNHGLYHRFGIQAITLEGFSSTSYHDSKLGFLTLGRILEGIFRSLNNLLERFHQSYFFYLLPASDRFVSIGIYIPAVCLLSGALFIRACAEWYQLQANPFATVNQDKGEGDSPKSERPSAPKSKDISSAKAEELPSKDKQTNVVQIGVVFILTHIIGVTIMNSPTYLTKVGLKYGYNTESSVFMGFLLISLALLLTPVFVTIRTCHRSSAVLNIISLLEFATTLICLSMYNFSLALICGVIYVPLLQILGPTSCRVSSTVRKVLWLLAHPLIVLNIIVFIYTFYTFPSEPLREKLSRSLGASQQAIVFSIVDSVVYGNWLYNVVTSILLPNWLCCWCVLFSAPKPKTEVVVLDKKIN